jgi:fatty-acyl-CoA synthase
MVVGVPDEKWGEAVTGVVQLAPGAGVAEQELQAFVRERLAGYKAPKRIVFVDDVGRSPSGKADYKRAKTLALGAIGPAGGGT